MHACFSLALSVHACLSLALRQFMHVPVQHFVNLLLLSSGCLLKIQWPEPGASCFILFRQHVDLGVASDVSVVVFNYKASLLV